MLIPAISECVIDTKPQESSGVECLLARCQMITNDIKLAVPHLVNVVAKPDEAPKTIDILMETTFVQTVDGPLWHLSLHCWENSARAFLLIEEKGR